MMLGRDKNKIEKQIAKKEQHPVMMVTCFCYLRILGRCQIDTHQSFRLFFGEQIGVDECLETVRTQ
jgi:hypothetical protein